MDLPIFDGHQDILSKLASDTRDPVACFREGSDFHIDYPKCLEGRWQGGFFAMWVDSPESNLDIQHAMAQPSYDLPLPEPLNQTTALNEVMKQIAIAQQLELAGLITICTDIGQLKLQDQDERLMAVLHLEGCEPIDEDFLVLDRLYQMGLRSLGPVWSRPNRFAEGVPFRFPGSPDIGGGLTELGIELIRRCNEKRILVDLSHLNRAGFDDVAQHSQQPLVATHSNAHQLCQHARNLTDEQLEMIAASRGLVGVNFACAFLRSDGQMNSATSLEQIIRHMDYLLERLGDTGVAIGSDFDGATVPEAIENASGLPVLVEAMLAHGYGEALVGRICYKNWLDLIERTWTDA